MVEQSYRKLKNNVGVFLKVVAPAGKESVFGKTLVAIERSKGQTCNETRSNWLIRNTNISAYVTAEGVIRKANCEGNNSAKDCKVVASTGKEKVVTVPKIGWV